MTAAFRVLWWDDALTDLAQLWIDAEDKAAVTNAASKTDLMLVTEPASKGEDVAEGLRRLEVGPLRVYFQIADDERIVEIVAVKLGARETRGNGAPQSS